MEEKPAQVRNAGGAVKKPAQAGVPLTRPLVAVQPVSSEKSCPVCGHINRAQSLMCEMCSNYLID